MEFEQPQLPFHHKHLPHLTKWSKFFGWKFMNLYFPGFVHYFTDKYEGRRHHLIIDTVYSLITFILLAVNIGLGVWYYTHFTPAQMDMRILTAAEVVSGEPTEVVVQYVNGGRKLEDVQLEVYLPGGFVPEDPEEEPATAQLGTIGQGQDGSLNLSGVVFGSVGEKYTVRAVLSYTSLGRRHSEVAVYTFEVVGSSLEVHVDFPKNVVYGVQVEGSISYINYSRIKRKNTEFTLEFPTNFILTSVLHKKTELVYDGERKLIALPVIKGNSSGKIRILGYFKRVYGEQPSGDQQTSFLVSVTSGIESSLIEEVELFYEGESETHVAVVEPRVYLSSTGTTSANFGEAVTTTITVSNNGDRMVKDVQLYAQISGAPLSPSGATASTTSLDGTLYYSRLGTSPTGITLPTIRKIKPGTSATVRLTIPTYAVDTYHPTGTITVHGTAHSPEIATTIPIAATSWTTQFNSQLFFSASAFYFGPQQEQLGYGPYPPRAWDTTALRVAFSLRNINNELSNTQVSTVLPPQIEWTGLQSVTAGTSMYYDPATRTVTWEIPSLAPQSQSYGAQFEVRITPNHLQIGLQPHLTESTSISASDAFSGAIISQYHGAVALPVAVIE